MSTRLASEQVVELRQSGRDSQVSPPEAQPANLPREKNGRRTLVASATAIGLAAAGALWITSPASSQTTDDAYVAADATSVAPKVSGLVGAVLVHDNQAVHAGDPLVRIDPEEFNSKVEAARANLADAEADVASARAALITHDAELRLASAQIIEARTSIRSSDAEAERAQADRQRTDALAARGFASRQTVDSFRSQDISAQQAAERSRAALAVSQQQAGLTASKKDALLADLEKASARRLAALAGLDLALQDQGHAVIRAPIDGVVGNRQTQVGDYVGPGTRLLSLVPVQAAYVTANFKETQVRSMRVGQEVIIKVDALPKALNGRIDGLAPGSGSTFALLPFEPGTGNFTKIVQRVPVRIRFERGQPGLDQLRPGLSVTATVHTSN